MHCDGKMPYANRGDAEKAKRALRRRSKDSDSMSVYQCQGCGLFHIGRNLRPKDPKRMRAVFKRNG